MSSISRQDLRHVLALSGKVFLVADAAYLTQKGEVVHGQPVLQVVQALGTNQDALWNLHGTLNLRGKGPLAQIA